MTPRQWLALFFFYISYLLFGASVFYHIEHEEELKHFSNDVQRRIDINEILVKYTEPKFHDAILQMVGDYCGKPVTNYTDGFQPFKWSFYHAFFFSFTVCSTVGYGNISPSTTMSRMFMILYGLIGIPMNGFLFAYLGDFFGKVFVTAYERYKTYKMATNKNYIPNQLGLIAQILLYLIPGIVIFLFLPSLIFRYFEGWDYSEAIYFSFVTLSTIGFGDYVPTFISDQEEKFGYMFYVYEVFIIFWFIFGLGYLVMIMSFIAKGLRSKKILRLESQLAENIRSTQTRIWNGVTKDVSYLRRILNEVYMMRFKNTCPEDEEPDDYLRCRRTSSCPDLSIYRQNLPTRKRAQSCFYHVDDDPDFLTNIRNIQRVQSDGDIHKVDRNRTSDETNAQMQPTELLARVFTALGNIKAADDEAQSIAAMSNAGFHGFSDSEILASEKLHDSKWSIQFSDSSVSIPPPKARGRAASDFRAPVPDQLELNNSHEWTWSGNNQQIEEFMRLRKLNKRKSPNLYRAALTSPKIDSPAFVVNVDGSPETPPPPPLTRSRSSSTSIFDRLNPFKKRDDSRKMSLTPDRLDVKSYLDRTSRGRMSASPIPYLTPSVKRRPSTYSMLSTNDEATADVLENTTIADLIRALEVMHTSAVIGDNSQSLENLLNGSSRPRVQSTSMHSTTIHNIQPQSPPPPPLINIFPPSTPTSLHDRRNSMRPLSTSNTPLFNRSNRRRQSTIDLPSSRRSSILMPTSTGPPPYSYSTNNETPRPHRRFSVRPTLLSIPPGQSPMPSVQATSSLQKKLSTLRPSPLLNDHTNLTVRPHRFGRSISTCSANYSGSELETSPLPNRSVFLTTVTESQLNVPQVRPTNRPKFLANLERRRCDSMK
ncbi:open rectifier potassium channel protein 1 [Contarinia nasturtii]|uniref:open rectifier potassium channel protein 1 n=1 Tax=Contarinia nasturtii TaxID=265458 RepID=UPI0012D3A43C|nr:open rectifier potassium channel protein 1 [Contarinia nasturtii]